MKRGEMFNDCVPPLLGEIKYRGDGGIYYCGENKGASRHNDRICLLYENDFYFQCF